MTAEVSVLAALFAGLISFLSPCVLPLVPPYLVYLAGTSLERLAEKEAPPRVRRDTVLAAALFVAGFSTIFVALGGAMRLEQVGLARGRRAAADVDSGDGRLGEHDGGDARRETGIVGLPDQNAGDVGDQISLRHGWPLRDCMLLAAHERCADRAARDRHGFGKKLGDRKRSRTSHHRE